jgi:hypothetical protein
LRICRKEIKEKILKMATIYGTPLNPPGGTYSNPVSYKAPLGGFGGKKAVFRHRSDWGDKLENSYYKYSKYLLSF